MMCVAPAPWYRRAAAKRSVLMAFCAGAFGFEEERGHSGRNSFQINAAQFHNDQRSIHDLDQTYEMRN